MFDAIPRALACQRVLVTGIDSVLGSNLAVTLAERFEILGLYGRVPVTLPNCRTQRFSPGQTASLAEVLAREAPHWVLHTGPFSLGSWDLGEDAFDAAGEVRTCRMLARWASRHGARLTVVTSDAVFAGPSLFHSEADRPTARSAGARAVRQVEQALVKTDALVVRTHAYGWSPPGVEPGFAERVWQSLRDGQVCPCPAQQYASPILATHLAELLAEAFGRRLVGLCHIAGAERASAYRFARELSLAFGLRGTLDPVDGSPCRRPADETAFDGHSARRLLGRPLPMLRFGLETFAHQARDGYRAQIRSVTPQRDAA